MSWHFQYQYQSRFESPIPTDLIGVGPDDVTMGWMPPLSEPPAHLAVEYRYLMPHLFQADVPRLSGVGPDDVTMGWVPPLDEPVLPLEYRYGLPTIWNGFDLVDTLPVPDMQWMGLPEVPVLRKPSVHLMDWIFDNSHEPPDYFVADPVGIEGWINHIGTPYPPVSAIHSQQFVFISTEPVTVVDTPITYEDPLTTSVRYARPKTVGGSVDGATIGPAGSSFTISVSSFSYSSDTPAIDTTADGDDGVTHDTSTPSASVTITGFVVGGSVVGLVNMESEASVPITITMDNGHTIAGDLWVSDIGTVLVKDSEDIPMRIVGKYTGQPLEAVI